MKFRVITGCLITAALVSCSHNDLVEEGKDSAMGETIACPQVADEPADLTQAVPTKYAEAQALPLKQHWASSMPAEAGVARIGASQTGLAVYVRYDDTDIFSTATANQQRMWQLGDVAEVFVKPGLDRSDYWEIHVTPNEFLMDLHIPSRAGMQSGEHTWDEIIAPASETSFQAQVAEGVWSAELIIPWSAFGLTQAPAAGTTWQFAVCRYNYNGGLEDPELSSTAPLAKRDFHLYEDYADLVF